MKNQKIITQDILLRIEKIKKYLKDKSFEDFKNDSLLVDAVKSNLIDIAEALKNLNKFFEYELSIEEKAIIKFRNLTTHMYWKRQEIEEWDLVNVELKKLENKIKK